MNETDFFNMYVERIINEVLELTKLKMINETRILFLEKSMLDLTKKIENLESESNENIRSEKRKPKIIKSDVFTSDNTF
jgi:hypothetical protein